MPSKERTRADLIEDIAKRICSITNENPLAWVVYKGHAERILSTILAALQEPTERMIYATGSYYIEDKNRDLVVWNSMLTASALGEQSDG